MEEYNYLEEINSLLARKLELSPINCDVQVQNVNGLPTMVS